MEHALKIELEEKQYRSGRFSLNILQGAEVLEAISQDEFAEDWAQLYQKCPWATVYQSLDFVQLWYQTYQQYTPILVVGFENKKLAGLLPLFRGQNKELSAAGANQAEYQVWISTTAGNDRFIENALREIRGRFPGHKLQLKYLPEQTPLSWASDHSWHKNVWVQPVKHPIMRINREVLDTELRKKNKREKVNRLKRMGELRFERITDYSAFTEVFDELAQQNDFRKGAVYNASYYHNNPIAKKFLLGLFERSLLHATVLKVDDEIIASNVGTISGRWVHLQGINTHSPAHAKHSPGILHFLMLGQLLADEGYEVFDLTPGSDPYKETLATEHIQSYKFTFQGTHAQNISKLKFSVAEKLKVLFNRMGINRYQQRSAKNKMLIASEKLKIVKKTKSLSAVLSSTSIFGEVGAVRSFHLHSNKDLQKNPALHINLNVLKDLLDFEPGGTLLTKWEFLEDAMKRLEAGQEFYTFNQGGRLLCCMWKQKPVPPGRAGKTETNDGGAPLELMNLYFHPKGESRIKEFLEGVLEEINSRGGHTIESAILRSKDKRVCRALAARGFDHDEEAIKAD